MQETFNPILSQEDVRGWSLTKEIPVPAPNTVLVLSRSGGELLVISHTDKPISFSKFKFGGYNFLYKIDVGEYVLKIDCSLPSKTSGFDFPTTVEITCSVSDAQIIVKAGTQDVASVLKARLINEMKQISRDYDLRENAMAEKDINRSVRRRVVDERCFDDLGLRVPQLVASLQIDSSAIGSIKQVTLTELNEAALLADKAAQFRLAQAEEIAQLKLDELKRMRASASQEYYEKLVLGDEPSLLAAYLAQNPGNIAELISRFDQQKQLSSGNNMELLKIMLQEDALEGSELGEASMRVLRRVMGLTESPKAALEGNAANQDPQPLSDDDDDLDDVPS
ncbi:MAG: hypothetical protein JGK40_30680 [Microcoleus sp. PH2017_21_RUC_O_A]|uniref:hypothetical protein n=1 Tax=Microcoleus sp. PH2017_21_RUC_O_A TaxID=2798832 RepID=UPI001DEE0829|nr:hypothetical protein [Microcoleus sp. PH2017_21_RUC_O_A]MCC3532320.1 hypothetical protein [Microcoleus sp. PH2017_21_RUC_O_A]